MRKIDHMAMKDILRKRQVKTASNTEHANETQQPTLLGSHKDITWESIVDKILKSDIKANHHIELSLEEKFTIIEFMSERQKISYNRGTLATLMKVWRCPKVCWVDNNDQCYIDEEMPIGKRPLRNFFLLSGHVAIFENILPKNVAPEQEDESGQVTFQTQSKPQQLMAAIQQMAQPKLIMQEHSGWGPMFRKQSMDHLNVILKITNAIIIEVTPPEFEGMLINLGGMDQEKKIKIIEHFPIFSNTSKRMQSILPYISLKKYSKNQYIYKIKQIPQAIYLILKGQIIFEAKVQLPKLKKNVQNKNLPNQLVFQTEALGIGNYFGEEQIIYKTTRTVNTVCHSAECDLLEIPLEKFEKLLTYTDFYDEVKNGCDIKIKKRKQKIQKAFIIHQQFSRNSQNSIQQPERERKSNTIDIKKQVKKKTTEPVRLMHGNIIRKVPQSSTNQQVSFSMLGANPDMYEATLKKFRKYTMKPAEKYKPEVNWNLKRVWKVLNLESILREDAEVTSPQGRKFYESHRRLQNHVQEVKSLRPKTSSSTYRTKLQYIAYLQQFNG